jgi:excisionase family DNA binding protein
MTTRIIQIENVDASALFERLERIEKAISGNNQPITPTPGDQSVKLLTRREVAQMLQISLVTVNDWANKGVLKAHKLGRRVYFKPSEVETSLKLKGGVYGR